VGCTRASPTNRGWLRTGRSFDGHGSCRVDRCRPWLLGASYRVRSSACRIKPVLIEILTAVSGITFEEAEQERVLIPLAGQLVPFIGRRALVANKRAAGRAKDLADVEALEGEYEP
jgi:hypothetical protein